jgi:hypothetical protein
LFEIQGADGRLFRLTVFAYAGEPDHTVRVEAKTSRFRADYNVLFLEGELQEWSRSILKLHKNLGSRLELASIEGDIRLCFTHDGLGHYLIEVNLDANYPSTDQLKLHFETDQSFLPGLAHGLLQLEAE